MVKQIVGLAVISIGILLLVFNGIGTIFRSVPTYLSPVTTPAVFRPSAYNELLKAFVKDDFVDYARLKSSPLLQKSLDELAKVSAQKMLDPKEQLSYWLNAYNLLTLKIICDRYPITNLEQQLGNDTNARKFNVGGQMMSVQDIMIQKIIPLLRTTDPRYLFFICGGAVGHPALLDHPIEPDKMDSDMEVASFKWISHPRNVRYDDITQTLYVSPFLNWYNQVLSTRYENPFEFVIPYLDERMQTVAHKAATIKSFGQRFNWTLNDLALKEKLTAGK
ncbi:MAG TPA: DUF547 domain-containing protein [Candidatus Obscuribacterales bacterium]